MPKVTIRLLGGFAASVDGTPVPDGVWRLRKARELVKMLALAPGRRLHREQAMDALWPERDPASAANNLHQAVHVARRALGPDAIRSVGETLVLEAEVDADEFERAAADPTPAGRRRALALYRGELLPENRYDDFALEPRERLAALADALREQAPAREGARRLPLDASSFVGREHELADLRVLLRRTRVLTLIGTGGAGKTRLALELARGAQDAFVDGAVLVDLAPVADGARVADAAAAALDVKPLPGRTAADALVEQLAADELLVVLDNCEHVLSAAAALADALVRSAPHLTVLATSREPLRVPGEAVFRVPSLAIPDPENLPPPAELARYEAVRLFVERAAAHAPGFALDAANAPDVARICFRLDGLPLALELAAGRVGALAPAAIAARLDDRFRLLRAGSPAAPTRQQTLAATLQWSHDLLTPPEAALLRRLAVFAGGFELDAVEEVCAFDGLDRADVADVLARLVEKSLVVAEPRAGGVRYRLLETIRAYARPRLAEAGETFVAAARHAAWALALAERTRGAPELDAEEANLRAALDTLLAHEPEKALRMCVAIAPFWLRRIELAEARRRFDDALAAAPARTPLRARALLAAGSIDFRAGRADYGLAHTRESLDIATEAGDHPAAWRALQRLGAIAVVDDHGSAAAREFRRSLAYARRHGLAAAAAVDGYSLGVTRWIEGDAAAAAELLDRSIEEFRALEDSDEAIPSLMNMGETTMTVGARIRLAFEETLNPLVDTTPRTAIGYAIVNRANVARTLGDDDHAAALLAEALRHFDEDGDDRGRADVFSRQAYLALARGDDAVARELFERVVELRSAPGDRRGVGLALVGLGSAATAAGDHARAAAHLAEAVALFRRAGDRWGLVSALWRSADLEFARGRPADAERLLEEAYAAVMQTQRHRWRGFTLVGLAEAAALLDRRDDALERLAAARAEFAEQGDELSIGAIDVRARQLAKAPLRARKDAPDTTSPTRSPRRRTR